ncbi:hypothetical protein GGX14DRAFT_604000 [Mycena pura]|uniref:Uncharacterized protein n=1 Tax=Mycena pura TaxID=153505 RepID=A0AAD6Y038_9AGAR|nr:hypothetical protein GGX14DRAFT_604000 [Mycena pura]
MSRRPTPSQLPAYQQSAVPAYQRAVPIPLIDGTHRASARSPAYTNQISAVTEPFSPAAVRASPPLLAHRQPSPHSSRPVPRDQALARHSAAAASQHPSVHVIQQSQRISVPWRSCRSTVRTAPARGKASQHTHHTHHHSELAFAPQIISSPPSPVAATPQRSFDFLAPRAFPPSKRARVPTSKAVVLQFIFFLFFSSSCRIFSVPGDGDVAIWDRGMWTTYEYIPSLFRTTTLSAGVACARTGAAATGIPGHHSNT